MSVWTCSPGGIVGVGVLSFLIAVWCLEWKMVLIRKGGRGKTSCPHSLLSLSHPISLSPASSSSFFLSSLWLSTWLHGMMAVLHGSLAGRGRRTDTKGWGKERGDVERAAHRLLWHRLPRCSPSVMPTGSKPLDASRGAARATKWAGNIGWWEQELARTKLPVILLLFLPRNSNNNLISQCHVTCPSVVIAVSALFYFIYRTEHRKEVI